MGNFCDYIGQVGKCGVYITSGNRCKRHQNRTERPVRSKIGKYSGASIHQQEIGSWKGIRAKK